MSPFTWFGTISEKSRIFIQIYFCDFPATIQYTPWDIFWQIKFFIWNAKLLLHFIVLNRKKLENLKASRKRNLSWWVERGFKHILSSRWVIFVKNIISHTNCTPKHFRRFFIANSMTPNMSIQSYFFTHILHYWALDWAKIPSAMIAILPRNKNSIWKFHLCQNFIEYPLKNQKIVVIVSSCENSAEKFVFQT